MSMLAVKKIEANMSFIMFNNVPFYEVINLNDWNIHKCRYQILCGMSSCVMCINLVVNKKAKLCIWAFFKAIQWANLSRKIKQKCTSCKTEEYPKIYNWKI